MKKTIAIRIGKQVIAVEVSSRKQDITIAGNVGDVRVNGVKHIKAS